MKTITYYNHTVNLDAEENVWVYALSGWVYTAETLEEAKKDIKENWRDSQYFYRHCC
jgi:hypothetical protein